MRKIHIRILINPDKSNSVYLFEIYKHKKKYKMKESSFNIIKENNITEHIEDFNMKKHYNSLKNLKNILSYRIIEIVPKITCYNMHNYIRFRDEDSKHSGLFLNEMIVLLKKMS